MKTFILADDKGADNLLPFTFTRPAADIRIGIMTIREKWEYFLKQKTSSLTRTYLSEKFPSNASEDNLLINGRVIPTADLVKEILSLQMNEALVHEDMLIAVRKAGKELSFDGGNRRKNVFSFIEIKNVWDIFSKNHQTIVDDFALLTHGRKSQAISKTNQVIAPENIFLEEGAKVECSILNASSGPIYLAKDAEIMEGSMVRGALALGEHAALKMGTKIYGATTIGPHSKVGGEVNNSVIFGYSNKAHDGFLGNSVLGEWCNLGADTNNSNLKNNYSEVKIWNYEAKKEIGTGLQFCGLLMGDHSKSGINTMFNTGTVVGVCANIFGGGFPKKHIPSFSWGGAAGFETFALDKAIEVATRVYERRSMEFGAVDRKVFEYLFKNK